MNKQNEHVVSFGKGISKVHSVSYDQAFGIYDDVVSNGKKMPPMWFNVGYRLTFADYKVVDLVIGEQIIKVVSCYAPQAGRSQIEKEEFWRQVERVIMNTDINQDVVVGGDMNGHVGQVANGFHEAHGNFGYGTRNAEGERILEQWDKVEKAMTEVAATVCGVTKGKCRQREVWWWCDEVEKAEVQGMEES